mmetsp:Transcript_70679/g.157240  ORF Transcript_70679/g.157240 Transcript_70679/m.157240 type:complete len:202 (-) Transcript_70679:236-841(-)
MDRAPEALIRATRQACDGGDVRGDDDSGEAFCTQHGHQHIARQVHAVRDEHGAQPVLGQPRPNRVGVAVDDGRAAIAQMREQRGATCRKLMDLLGSCQLVAERDNYARRNGVRAKLSRTAPLGSDCEQPDVSAGERHQLIKERDPAVGGVEDVRGGMAADGPRLVRDERTLQMDTKHTAPQPLTLACVGEEWQHMGIHLDG